MKNLIKIGAVSAIAFATLSAQAVTFAFQTAGTYTESNSGGLTSNELSPTYRSGHTPLLTVTSVNYSFSEVTPGSVGFPPSQIVLGGGAIKGKYNNVDYTLNFTIGSGGVFRASKSTKLRSFAGDIVSFSIAGSALNGYTGSGTFGGTLLGGKDIFSGISKTSFDLEAQAVPEPASMAALGLGLAGIAARRKRK